jgi:hypothetical protein
MEEHMRIFRGLSIVVLSLGLSTLVLAQQDQSKPEQSGKPPTHEAKPPKPAKTAPAARPQHEQAQDQSHRAQQQQEKQQKQARQAEQQQERQAKEQSKRSQEQAQQAQKAQEKQARDQQEHQQKQAQEQQKREEKQAQEQHQREQQQAEQNTKQAQKENTRRAEDQSKRARQDQQREIAQQRGPIQEVQRSQHGPDGRPDREARIPHDRFREHFGREHRFAIRHPVIIDNEPRFQYSGYWFEMVDPWPVAWSYDDDCYIDYVDDDYYLFDPLHPGIRIAVVIVN